MNRQKILLLVVALSLMGGAAGVLARMKSNQRLGLPGVKTEPLAGSRNLRVLLPARVLEYESEEIPPDSLVVSTLPADTSYGHRRYFRRDKPSEQLQMTAVLMGTDRTSIHKPQFCLAGQGWAIDNAASEETSVPVEHPQPYTLPVIKIISSRTLQNASGQSATFRAVFVYWFVADGAISGNMTGRDRMWWMAKHLLRTGELQRWAYVSCFTICLPGQEEAAFERVKEFISAAVPQFQLTPKPAEVESARK